MMKQISLAHALVVLIGPSAGGKTTYAAQFAPNEVVSTDKLRLEYLGDESRQDERDLIFNEFDRRIQNRLELGLRVVADATHVRNSDRRRTARLAAKFGAKVVYVVVNRPMVSKLAHAGWRENVYVDGKPLILRQEETFVGNEGSILGGHISTTDGISLLADLVVDTRKEQVEIVKPLTRGPLGVLSAEQAPLADITSRGYQGIMVIGDVHGNLIGLQKMRQFAQQKQLFMVLLGDIVDYATDTLNTADEVAEIVFSGAGISILGNHEKKIHKWVTKERETGMYGHDGGFTGDLSLGNEPTVNQIKAMLPEDRLIWETRFLGLCASMPHAVRMGKWFFTHGAAGKRMFDATEFRFQHESTEESYALYGQTTGNRVGGFPERVYTWADEIPPRINVVVGHDCRSDIEPFIQHGAAGGRAIFLDTGSSKKDRFPNGHLSALSLEITSRRKIGYVLENERFISEWDL